jgi:hypothetical protein
MLVLKPRKRKRARKGTAAPETAEAAATPETTEPPEAPVTPEAPAAPETTAAHAPAAASTRGFIRKSAIRHFLKREYDFPLQIREAFFAAAEAKFSDDLRRSVARAREFKRSTLMGPDA